MAFADTSGFVVFFLGVQSPGVGQCVEAVVLLLTDELCFSAEVINTRTAWRSSEGCKSFSDSKWKEMLQSPQQSLLQCDAIAVGNVQDSLGQRVWLASNRSTVSYNCVVTEF